MRSRRIITWVVAIAMGVVVLAPTLVNAHPEEAVRPVMVVNSPDQPVPVSVQGTPTVNVGNTPSVNIAGIPTVNIGNTPSVAISGTPTVAISGTPTVDVGNLPAVQRVEVVNEAASLVRGTLTVDIRNFSDPFPETSIPAGVTLTDIVASVSAGGGADCNLLISHGGELLFRGLIPNRNILTLDLASGLTGPLTLGTSMGGGSDSFCSGRILWTGTS